MSRTSLRRRLTVGGCALALTAGAAFTASPASAGSLTFSKSSGRVASASWVEVGTLPGVAGNVHFGDIQVEEMAGGKARAFGIVFDLDCPVGVVPAGPGGGHGDPHAPASPCTDAGVRFIDGGTLSLAMDRRLSSARLTGNLRVAGHDGGTLGLPPVDMTWTGVGATSSSVESGRTSVGGTSYSYRYSFTGREATLSGRIGPMVVDDHPQETSSAQMGAYRVSSRDRTR